MKTNNLTKLTNKLIYQYADAAIDIFAAIDWYKLSKIIQKHFPDVKDVDEKVYLALSNFHKLDKKVKANYYFKIFKVRDVSSYFNGSNKPINFILTGIELKDRNAAISFAYKFHCAKEIYMGDSSEKFLTSGELSYRTNPEIEKKISKFLTDSGFEKIKDDLLQQLAIFTWREDFDFNQFASNWISTMVRYREIDQQQFCQLILDYHQNIRIPYLYGFTRTEAKQKLINQDKSIIDLINKIIGKK